MKKSTRLPRPAGLTLLGSAVATFPDTPGTGILEKFANPKPARAYVIRLDCPDFTSLCPVTGQPDFAALRIEYVAGKACVETKSLKLYLASYRNTPSFNERVVNRILDDLVAVIRPRAMRIEAKFAARGGIALTVVAAHGRLPRD